MTADPTFCPRIYRVSIRAGVLLGCLGLLAWGTGRPFIFPSLGPTAFVLSDRTRLSPRGAWTVIGGHAWGTGAGLASYVLLASGTTLLDLRASGSLVGLELAASGTLAMVLTSILMMATRSVHPPACATTLIVSLGLLSTPVDGLIIVGAVALLYGLARAERSVSETVG